MIQLQPKCPVRPSRISLASITLQAPPGRLEAAATQRAATVRERSGWTALPGGVIDGGEIVMLAIKPSMWRPLFDSAPWLVTCCLLAGALTWLGKPIPGLSLTATAQLVLLIAFARTGMAVVRWVPTWYVLTNRRILDIRGVRSPRISACLLTEVRNTYLNSSLAEKLTRLGTITFVTDQEERLSHLWQSVAKPDDVHTRIRRAIENAIDQHGIGA